MGRQLIAASLSAGHTITGGTETAQSSHLKHDLGELAGQKPIGLTPVTDVVNAAGNASVWIDFTTPAATLVALETLRHTGVQTIVIGTTGFTETETRAIERAAQHFAIVKAGNFSLGVNLMLALTKLAASRLGPDWDIEILETHHRRKVDAPSGTALMLGEAAADGRGHPLSDLQATALYRNIRETRKRNDRICSSPYGRCYRRTRSCYRIRQRDSHDWAYRTRSRGIR